MKFQAVVFLFMILILGVASKKEEEEEEETVEIDPGHNRTIEYYLAQFLEQATAGDKKTSEAVEKEVRKHQGELMKGFLDLIMDNFDFEQNDLKAQFKKFKEEFDDEQLKKYVEDVFGKKSVVVKHLQKNKAQVKENLMKLVDIMLSDFGSSRKKRAGPDVNSIAGAVASSRAGAIAGSQAGAIASSQAGAIAGSKAGALASSKAGALANSGAGAQAGAEAEAEAESYEDEDYINVDYKPLKFKALPKKNFGGLGIPDIHIGEEFGEEFLGKGGGGESSVGGAAASAASSAAASAASSAAASAVSSASSSAVAVAESESRAISGSDMLEKGEALAESIAAGGAEGAALAQSVVEGGLEAGENVVNNVISDASILAGIHGGGDDKDFTDNSKKFRFYKNLLKSVMESSYEDSNIKEDDAVNIEIDSNWDDKKEDNHASDHGSDVLEKLKTLSVLSQQVIKALANLGDKSDNGWEEHSETKSGSWGGGHRGRYRHQHVKDIFSKYGSYLFEFFDKKADEIKIIYNKLKLLPSFFDKDNFFDKD